MAKYEWYTRVTSITENGHYTAYRGFDKDFKSAECIAVVVLPGQDGERETSEVWALDNDRMALTELSTYYQDIRTQPVTIMIFKNVNSYISK